VDAALVPVIAYQLIENVRMIPDVCVGARKKVRSVCLVTKGADLKYVKSVSLDISSKTSVALTKIIFREFLGFEPKWIDAKPDLDKMLNETDCALLIGDPALLINYELRITNYELRVFDLVELWREFTGLGFVFAMWMTRNETCDIDFAKARDEGLNQIDEIIANYETEISLTHDDFKKYLTENISFSIDDSMQRGLELYFELAHKNGLIADCKKILNT
jgi:chorismate dehydratase